MLTSRFTSAVDVLAVAALERRLLFRRRALRVRDPKVDWETTSRATTTIPKRPARSASLLTQIDLFRVLRCEQSFYHSPSTPAPSRSSPKSSPATPSAARAEMPPSPTLAILHQDRAILHPLAASPPSPPSTSLVPHSSPAAHSHWPLPASRLHATCPSATHATLCSRASCSSLALAAYASARRRS